MTAMDAITILMISCLLALLIDLYLKVRHLIEANRELKSIHRQGALK